MARENRRLCMQMNLIANGGRMVIELDDGCA
jgi:hypothetical protein